MECGDAFEACYSPARSFLAGLLSFGLVALGLWMMGAFGEAPRDSIYLPDWAIPIFGLLSTIFFGAIGARSFYRTVASGLALRIDKVGMTVLGYGEDRIPWDDFADLSSQNLLGTSFLTFDVVPARFNKFSLFRQAVWKANELLVGSGGALNANSTNHKHDELVDALKHFAPPKITDRLR